MRKIWQTGAYAGAILLMLTLTAAAVAQEQRATGKGTGTAPAQEQAAPPEAPDGVPANGALPSPQSSIPCRPASQYQPMDEKMPCPPEKSSAPGRITYTVPAGTKVLLQLRSSVNTRSAKPGDGVYLASTFPVVVGTRVMIPAGVYVQGVVDRVRRAGRMSGHAQLDMHFTSIIFPNGTVVEVPGLVNSLPGASKQKVKNDGEGTIEQDGGKGRNAGETAKIAIPTGGTVGSIAGIGSGHPLEGGLVGLAAGAATVGLVSLFTRGADVNIESGTQVEMVLQRPLLLEEANLSPDAQERQLVPSPNQPKPLPKPAKMQILCPTGELGCS